MLGIGKLSDELRFPVVEALLPVVTLNMALKNLLMGQPLMPTSVGRTWPEHLNWGVHSAVAAVRMLLCGQTLGAAALARNQLERWTTNRAFLAKVTKRSGEAEEDFIARVWSSAIDERLLKKNPTLAVAFEGDIGHYQDEPQIDHAHVQLRAGRDVCPAVLWMNLSEILHGRLANGTVDWEVESCLGEPIPDDVWRAYAVILDALGVGLNHVRRVVEAVHRERGNDREVAYLRGTEDTFSEPSDDEPEDPPFRSVTERRKIVAPSTFCLMPLTPEEGLSDSAINHTHALAMRYEGVRRQQRPDGRLYRDDELSSLGFAWHRALSIRCAQAALDIERKQLGKSFNVTSIHGRATRWTLVAEGLALAAKWMNPSPQGAAAATAASALRSASWLWLEDDHRSMAVLRTVLEQVARMRTWRIKPTKAARLESSSASPSRWLEGAGWRRLGPLNIALGEFAHLTDRSEWSGAHAFLTTLQSEADSETAQYTARRSALELVESLAADEAIAALEAYAPVTSARLKTMLMEYGAVLDNATIDGWFNHIWAHNQQFIRS